MFEFREQILTSNEIMSLDCLALLTYIYLKKPKTNPTSPSYTCQEYGRGKWEDGKYEVFEFLRNQRMMVALELKDRMVGVCDSTF